MYSGTTFRHASGNVLGAHQKIDRVAWRALQSMLPDSPVREAAFPDIKEILHFEGKNGPDGIKRKSPAQDEPWHYYNPDDPADTALLDMLRHHGDGLARALADGDRHKAAFEAAWLAHAVVDGLTPAHHFPLQEELERLRGEGIETRTNVKEKLLIRQPGDSGGQVLSKNWQFWGAKGIMTSHVLFEIGVATTIKPLKLANGHPTQAELREVRQRGFVPVFKDMAAAVYGLHMYEEFYKYGWTRLLARQTRRELAPVIVKAVALAWYDAAVRARGAQP